MSPKSCILDLSFSFDRIVAALVIRNLKKTRKCWYNINVFPFYSIKRKNRTLIPHERYCLSPSTISSESSTKNSLSGGLFGRLSVFNSCWILVDTLLLTGTPAQTPRTATVTNILYVNKKQQNTSAHPHMHFHPNTNLYLITHSHEGRTLCTSTQSGSESAAGKIQREIGTLGDTDWITFRRGSLCLILWHETDIETDRQTPGWKASWFGASSASLPFPRFDLYYLFFFLF